MQAFGITEDSILSPRILSLNFQPTWESNRSIETPNFSVKFSGELLHKVRKGFPEWGSRVRFPNAVSNAVPMQVRKYSFLIRFLMPFPVQFAVSSATSN